MRHAFKYILIILILLPVISFAEGKPSFQVKTNPAVSQVKTKKPVRIHLKRYSDGKYAWDITGESVEQIIKADRKLRKIYGENTENDVSHEEQHEEQEEVFK